MESNNPAISGNTRVYCLIGDPVDHSLSPAIQNTAFRLAGLDAVYVSLRVRAHDLRSAVQGLRSIGVSGFNVTTPHKSNIIRYLHKLDSASKETRSVNTVVAGRDGVLAGRNTDGIGAVKALERAGAPLNKKVLLFGAGGAARTIAFAIAPQAESIRLLNRTSSKAAKLERLLKGKFHTEVTHHALSKIQSLIADSDLIINASSMGMEGNPDVPIEQGWIRPDQWVMDIVYRPQQTRLLAIARRAEARTIDGLDMLVGQGACSFELWTGLAAPIEEMRRALVEKSLEFAHAKSS